MTSPPLWFRICRSTTVMDIESTLVGVCQRVCHRPYFYLRNKCMKTHRTSNCLSREHWKSPTALQNCNYSWTLPVFWPFCCVYDYVCSQGCVWNMFSASKNLETRLREEWIGSAVSNTCFLHIKVHVCFGSPLDVTLLWSRRPLLSTLLHEGAL